jgi:hypothetical protein
MQPLISSDKVQHKLEQILEQSHTLCKEDILWILEYVKKKVADQDPSLLELSQPRLLKNFHCFAEVAMMLIHRRHKCEQELDLLKSWLYEATHGLHSNEDKPVV